MEGASDEKSPKISIKTISEQWAVITAMWTVFVSVIAIIGTYSYLSEFDHKLIWFIDYSDIVKIIIVFAAYASPLFIVLYMVPEAAKDLEEQIRNPGYHKLKVLTTPYLLFVTVGFVFMTCATIFGFASWSNLQKTISITMIYLILLGLYQFIRKAFNNSQPIALLNVILLIVYITIIPSLIGRYIASNVLQESTYRRSITIKENSNYLDIDDVIVIFVTSHHVAFKKDDEVIVLPTSDVVRLTSRAVKKG